MTFQKCSCPQYTRYSWIVWPPGSKLPVRFVEQRRRPQRRPCGPRRIPLRCTGCNTHPFDLKHFLVVIFVFFLFPILLPITLFLMIIANLERAIIVIWPKGDENEAKIVSDASSAWDLFALFFSVSKRHHQPNQSGTCATKANTYSCVLVSLLWACVQRSQKCLNRSRGWHQNTRME